MPVTSVSRFVCDNCGKAYRTKDSLTRHRHNHDHAGQHICAICSMHFSRSDVLYRHARIHHKGRKRSPRACISCKTSKVKCDAGQPCSRCVRTFQTCTYESEAGPGNEDLTHATQSMPSSSLPQDSDGIAKPSVIFDTSAESVHAGFSPAQNAFRPNFGPNLIPMATGVPSYDRSLVSENNFDTQIKPTYTICDGSWTPNPNPWLQSLDIPLSSANWLRQPGGVWNNNYPSLDANAANNLLLAGANASGTELFDVHGGTTLETIELLGMTGNVEYVPGDLFLFDTVNGYSTKPSYVGNFSNEFGQHYMGNSMMSFPSLDNYSRLSLTRIPTSMIQRRIIEDLVEHAFSTVPESYETQKECLSYWREMGAKVEKGFLCQLSEESREAGSSVLDYFVTLYLKKFFILWPLFRLKDFDAHHLIPALYLICTATGAMYSGPGGRLYGSMMIEHLFSEITSSKYMYMPSTEPIELVLCFMVLTQISALYFGQRRGFYRAKQLGQVILSHARKATLFDELAELPSLSEMNLELQFERFIRSETRKRIAFGIFRADVFTSSVLNVRPLMSFEEINLRLPCPDDLWLRGDVSDWQKLRWLPKEGSDMLYSDLARMSMDQSVPMPHLSLTEQDLILFANQDSVWRFCHDPRLFNRMIGKKVTNHSAIASDGKTSGATRSEDSSDVVEIGISSNTEAEDLNSAIEKMNNLKLDYDRTVQSLQKWRLSFINTIAIERAQANRYRLLNSQLLYHLSFLRLKTDISSLDLLTSSLDDPTQRIGSATARVYAWTHTAPANEALEHALAIWKLISKESSWDGPRASFNILSLIALYHAAMVVWAYAGAHEGVSGKYLQMYTGVNPQRDLHIHRGNSRVLLGCFVDLFKRVAAGWSAWSSFAMTVTLMAKMPCPIPAG